MRAMVYAVVLVSLCSSAVMLTGCSTKSTKLTFINHRDRPVEVEFVTATVGRQMVGRIQPGKTKKYSVKIDKEMLPAKLNITAEPASPETTTESVTISDESVREMRVEIKPDRVIEVFDGKGSRLD